MLQPVHCPMNSFDKGMQALPLTAFSEMSVFICGVFELAREFGPTAT